MLTMHLLMFILFSTIKRNICATFMNRLHRIKQTVIQILENNIHLYKGYAHLLVKKSRILFLNKFSLIVFT